MTMAVDAREVALATGADFECDFRGAGQVGIMQPLCVNVLWLGAGCESLATRFWP